MDFVGRCDYDYKKINLFCNVNHWYNQLDTYAKRKKYRKFVTFPTINKTLCHPEFISGSLQHEMLPHGGQVHKAHTSPVHFVKQVQHDIKIIRKIAMLL